MRGGRGNPDPSGTIGATELARNVGAKADPAIRAVLAGAEP